MSGYAPTLGASITNVSASLTLSADSGDNGHVEMLIDGEILEGDKSGTTVSNLVRATEKFNGSAVAASHNAGAIVYFIQGRQLSLQAFAYKYDEQSVTGGSVASFTIPASGSIPTWANNMRIYWKAKGDNAAAQTLVLRFNGDVGASYNYQFSQSAGTNTFTGTASTGQSSMRVGAVADSAANLYNSGWIDIEDLQPATRHGVQAMCHRADTSVTTGTEWDSGVWLPASLAAITSITVLPGVGNFTTAVFRTYIFP